MAQRISIIDAKEELVKINSILTKPHILIGGLAVNQYEISRTSNDIDLVIEYEIANYIIDKLYPSLKWRKIDRNNDEIRPSYEIVNRANPEFIIRFGPKILQRQPYDFIDWKILFNGAKQFKYQTKVLENILVPSPVHLSFTKLLSYIARRDKSPIKAISDLEDFCNLSNNEAWNVIDFYTILNNTGAFDYLKEKLIFSKTEKEILENSSFFHLVNLFRKTTDEIAKIPNPTTEQKKRVENAIAAGEEFSKKEKGKIIAAIGMDLIGFSAINMKYGSELGDKIINIIVNLIEKVNLKQHKAEVVGDTFIVYLALENKEELEGYAANLHRTINTHNWREIQENLYINSYTTFGTISENESIHDFAKRVFDSILSQKANGEIFKQANEKTLRGDWNIDQMVSYR